MSYSPYDALNRPTSKTYSGTATETVEYSYDTCGLGKGRLCGVTAGPTSAATTVSYSYTDLGQVSTKIAAVPKSGGGNETYKSWYTYDARDNLLAVTQGGEPQLHV